MNELNVWKKVPVGDPLLAEQVEMIMIQKLMKSLIENVFLPLSETGYRSSTDEREFRSKRYSFMLIKRSREIFFSRYEDEVTYTAAIDEIREAESPWIKVDDERNPTIHELCLVGKDDGSIEIQEYPGEWNSDVMIWMSIPPYTTL